ncbi:MAG: rhomboid family intramembrane serine protease [Acetatifactor sp.]
MSKWERKFGKYAIPNLTVILIGCYVVGYILTWLAPGVLDFLTLNPYKILHGQVWRILTWVIAPPSSLTNYYDLFFVMIMLMFYFNLGTSLERVWGTWRYNVYIFTGILVTVAASFICMGIYYLVFDKSFVLLYSTSLTGEIHRQFSTYYINMSIFLAYALTFPNAEVLLMFLIPVKVKWLGIIYGAMLTVQMVEYLSLGSIYWPSVAAIAASLINFLIFWMRNGKHVHLGAKQRKRRAEFKQDIKRNPRITKHKCAVCGRTEDDDPTLEFRFCSKCNGNYEYCQYHLFTHEHVK